MEFKKLWTVMIALVLGSCYVIYEVVLNKNSFKFISYLRLKTWTNYMLPILLPQEPNSEGDKMGHFAYVDNIPPPVKAQGDKYIIYRCQSVCGGLADRERGIITAYVVSQMLRRNFGIILDRRCDFSKYVVPNLVNWVVNQTLIKGKTVGSKRNVDDWALGKQMRDGNLEYIYNKEVMYYQGNIGFVVSLMNKMSFRSLPWTRGQHQNDIYRIAFGHLFKLAPETEKKYMKFRKMVASHQLFCTHIRMGKSKTIPRDAILPYAPNATAVIKFLQGKISNSSKVFVATDSDEVRVQMKQAFPSQFLEVEGPIVHIDRSGGVYACSGMEKAILDQFILSRCDTLLMSRSGFSAYSALMRGTDKNLFMVKGSNITQANHLNPF